jgi:tetratricopeptide (TPR) repeat protein
VGCGAAPGLFSELCYACGPPELVAERGQSQTPSYAECYFERAAVYHRLDRNEDALADYEQAIRLSPPFPEAYYNRGDVRADLGDTDGAIADFGQSSSLIRPMWTPTSIGPGCRPTAATTKPRCGTCTAGWSWAHGIRTCCACPVVCWPRPDGIEPARCALSVAITVDPTLPRGTGQPRSARVRNWRAHSRHRRPGKVPPSRSARADRRASRPRLRVINMQASGQFRIDVWVSARRLVSTILGYFTLLCRREFDFSVARGGCVRGRCEAVGEAVAQTTSRLVGADRP